MIVTITEYVELARDGNGNVVPLGAGRVACQARTSDGAFAPTKRTTRFLRVATDTAIRMDAAGGTTDADDELFLPGVEFISTTGGKIFTIAMV